MSQVKASQGFSSYSNWMGDTPGAGGPPLSQPGREKKVGGIPPLIHKFCPQPLNHHVTSHHDSTWDPSFSLSSLAASWLN